MMIAIGQIALRPTCGPGRSGVRGRVGVEVRIKVRVRVRVRVVVRDGFRAPRADLRCRMPRSPRSTKGSSRYSAGVVACGCRWDHLLRSNRGKAATGARAPGRLGLGLG